MPGLGRVSLSFTLLFFEVRGGGGRGGGEEEVGVCWDEKTRGGRFSCSLGTFS